MYSIGLKLSLQNLTLFKIIYEEKITKSTRTITQQTHQLLCQKVKIISEIHYLLLKIIPLLLKRYY